MLKRLRRAFASCFPVYKTCPFLSFILGFLSPTLPPSFRLMEVSFFPSTGLEIVRSFLIHLVVTHKFLICLSCSTQPKINQSGLHLPRTGTHPPHCRDTPTPLPPASTFPLCSLSGVSLLTCFQPCLVWSLSLFVSSLYLIIYLESPSVCRSDWEKRRPSGGWAGVGQAQGRHAGSGAGSRFRLVVSGWAERGPGPAADQGLQLGSCLRWLGVTPSSGTLGAPTFRICTVS